MEENYGQFYNNLLVILIQQWNRIDSINYYKIFLYFFKTSNDKNFCTVVLFFFNFQITFSIVFFVLILDCAHLQIIQHAG